MQVAKPGDRISIHYIGTLDNGHIFDSADANNPLSFTIGEDEIFPALERAIVGMKLGSTANIEIKAVDAYGPRRDENLLHLPRSQFPAGRKMRVGEKLSLAFANGEERIMQIMKLAEDEVTLDANHPLAGLDLTFALQLEKIERPHNHPIDRIQKTDNFRQNSPELLAAAGGSQPDGFFI